jgi:hypothetical protein
VLQRKPVQAECVVRVGSKHLLELCDPIGHQRRTHQPRRRSVDGTLLS